MVEEEEEPEDEDKDEEDEQIEELGDETTALLSIEGLCKASRIGCIENLSARGGCSGSVYRSLRNEMKAKK